MQIARMGGPFLAVFLDTSHPKVTLNAKVVAEGTMRARGFWRSIEVGAAASVLALSGAVAQAASPPAKPAPAGPTRVPLPSPGAPVLYEIAMPGGGTYSKLVFSFRACPGKSSTWVRDRTLAYDKPVWSLPGTRYQELMGKPVSSDGLMCPDQELMTIEAISIPFEQLRDLIAAGNLWYGTTEAHVVKAKSYRRVSVASFEDYEKLIAGAGTTGVAAAPSGGAGPVSPGGGFDAQIANAAAAAFARAPSIAIGVNVGVTKVNGASITQDGFVQKTTYKFETRNARCNALKSGVLHCGYDLRLNLSGSALGVSAGSFQSNWTKRQDDFVRRDGVLKSASLDQYMGRWAGQMASNGRGSATGQKGETAGEKCRREALQNLQTGDASSAAAQSTFCGM